MIIIDFIRHFFSSSTRTQEYSPLVLEFCQEVLKKGASEEGKRIDQLRKGLLKSTESIVFRDLGAKGDTSNPMRQTTVGRIARSSARRRNEGEFLHRLCKFYQPQRCLELGTNLGISTLYQATALKGGQFISLEGAPNLLKIASNHFSIFNVDIKIKEGDFSDSLGDLGLDEIKPDYVFIDGNHRYEPTLEYFRTILPHMPERSIMIFDDIYWSAGMKKAWNEIISDQDVSVSIDLFFFGICFIKYPGAKQHHKLRLL